MHIWNSYSNSGLLPH